MSESAYAAPGNDLGGIADDEDFGSDLPGRPRRKFLNQWSACLVALVVGAVGFYVGVRVEKSDVSGNGGGARLAGAFVSRLGEGGATSKTRSTKTGATRGASTFASRFGGVGAGAFSGGTTGTVSSVDGNTLYVKESSGNTVKVRLSSATTITKSESVSKNKINPGDAIVVDGVTGSKGRITATSVTDSGAGSTSTASTTGSSTAGSSASSVISSLFGGG